jgi:glycosyltransferase involved in cell wall biosynthesis
LKILHLLYESRDDYFGIGGVGIRAYEIYRYLKDRHEITLLCKKYPGAADGEREGLTHMFVGTESGSLAKTLLSYAYHASQFVRRHGKEYDIIVEEFSPAIPTFLHFMTKRPIILQVQGYSGSLYFRKYNPLYAATLYAMESLRPIFYKNFIYITSAAADRLRTGQKRRIAIISNGISPDLLKIVPVEGEYILYLGRIDIYGKGLDILLKAYKDFYAAFPAIRLVIAGDGRDMEKFKDMLMDLPEDVRKNVELLGWVDGVRKGEVIRRALCTVFPSRHEIQSIALIEALAGEKPVIVSSITEFRIVAEKGAGISFETQDASSLTQSMNTLITSKEREEMGRRGREWVRDLTWDKIALKYENFLQDIVSGRKPQELEEFF